MNRLTLLPLVLLALGAATVARADTLHRSGPAEERLDLVILGDGFRAQDQGRFDEAARRLWEALRTTEPFSQYTGLLNVHTGFRASAESGTGPNTAYGTRFVSADSNALYADRLALLLGDAVRAGGGEVDRVIVIVDSGRHGGATVGTVAYVSTGMDWISTALHELGHLVGNVGDEYEHTGQQVRWTALAGGDEAAARRLITDRYANLTLASTREALPWREWVQPSTHVPARSLSDGVSAWEGGGYFAQGIYRPQRTCRMRTNWHHFCAVCREQLVLQLHELASPVRLEVTTDQGSSRRVRLVTALPADRWAVRWGGVAGSGLEAVVPAGASASVILEDATPWVLGARREGLRYRFVVPASGAPGPVTASSPPAAWPRAGVVTGLTTRLRVRASASTQAAILGHLNPGATVQVTGPAVDGFYPITFAGGRGYVGAAYVRLTTPPATTGIVGVVGS